MPPTPVVIFAEDDGSVPLFDWMDGLPVKVRDKCLVRIERLAAMGHELRRPEADFLRDGVHELRVRHGSVNYRILYFFEGGLAVVSHGCTKEGEVPPIEIERALNRKNRYAANPNRHTHEE